MIWKGAFNYLHPDHMILPVSLVFGHVTIATSSMTFYECGAVSRLNQSSQYVQMQQASNPAVSNVSSRRSTMPVFFRCLACVGSVWNCNWCPLDQLCTHNNSCPNQHIILSQRVRQPVCLFESLICTYYHPPPGGEVKYFTLRNLFLSLCACRLLLVPRPVLWCLDCKLLP